MPAALTTPPQVQVVAEELEKVSRGRACHRRKVRLFICSDFGYSQGGDSVFRQWETVHVHHRTRNLRFWRRIFNDTQLISAH